ncbi:cation:proton antiporter [Streptomyces sp. F63]|uniref:cation:proton antiporter n=1 Tax=Streptomyces sp. F63 TaxID=2824887 RepID=UPI001B36C33A|nr:cation:proton antiporter family protein [Streptomyces sp. F63]MBQ0986141.1 cation:proton antiporter [Streptomyces sp. F63]
MSPSGFALIAVVLAVSAAVGLLAVRLRQPLIVGFIGVGILVGPTGLGWVEADGTIDLLARMGIAILLFLVGLRLDLNLIRATGPIAVATGLGQVLFTSVIGFLIALGLGMDTVTALYVAVALTFSSTIIIVKLLSDKRELEQLHGRIAVGFLIVQDIVVILVMIVLTAFGREADGSLPVHIALVFAKGLGLLAGAALLMRWVLPRLVRQVARSPELLVLFGVAYAALVATVSNWLGFGTEVGAFLAGVSLAGTPYRDALGARLVSLRDFLLLFFFLELGALLQFDDASQQLARAAVFSVFVLVGNPLIVILIVTAMRYPVRVGFLAGLAGAQISEFSLILAALGLSLGHLTGATVSLITVVGLVTIGVSTYLILYSQQIYARLERRLSVLERTEARKRDLEGNEREADVVLYGLGRFGGALADRLGRAGHRVLALDFDPHRVARNDREGVDAMFGCVEDMHLLESLPLARARCVISTVPLPEEGKALVQGLRQLGYEGSVVLTARSGHDAELLDGAGADLVLQPYPLAATATAEALDRLLRRDGGEGATEARG